ncbi:3'-hydroxy-N-methyl-(S)-coclaurine 4'-O-methyltransferase-like [Pyrus ussuriensis x Pyrus communis]|uniref:3'-hydroxy-N-methyl-(S)-coclaurine 4'-O-methyltransferase-like n=1 Tax=Pyrus ussuriensis x Pyrus communis TaxID=2448454 RepID=A0A5N5I7Y3_9ROSA|nr:3'-hydroxy-N-methyl-(S)-coclaurine 4'-O-methyltransferase-like [Pyrus ussuriensis x Pyrus communis]
MTLLELSSALSCDPSHLYRVMRVLVHLKIFKEKPTELGPKVHGEDVCSFATANPNHSKLINDAMACDARIAVPAVIERCLEVFKGLETIVGVGGGDGTTLRLLVETCPWIRGIDFDLPRVVSVAQESLRNCNLQGPIPDLNKIQKENSTSVASNAHGEKYRKPKPTNPKPFRFRTDVCETCCDQFLYPHAPLKEITLVRTPGARSTSKHHNVIQQQGKMSQPEDSER